MSKGRLLTSIALLATLAACGDSAGPDEGEAILSGTVLAAESSAPLDGATISLGARTATTGSDGRFELTGIPIGPGTLRAERPGYMPAEAAVTIIAGTNSHDLALESREIYVSGPYATLVPAGAAPIRGVIITLGGPDVSGFVTGERIAPADRPLELERSLQSLGASLRQFARASRLALFGSANVAMPNSAASDAAIFQALETVAELSGHPEIASAPVFVMGLSAGGREASGLASRNAGRTLGVLVRVPTEVSSLSSPEALAVPTFVLQAELDVVANNTAVREIFKSNRSRGGLWALAVEPDIGHGEPTSKGNSATIIWFGTVLSLRLPAAPGESLIPLSQESGWLGNPVSLEIAPWADYAGSRGLASWLPSESTANSWKNLMTSRPSDGQQPPVSNAAGSFVRE